MNYAPNVYIPIITLIIFLAIVIAECLIETNKHNKRKK